MVAEKQFEMAGVTFGLGCGVEIASWTPGGPALRVNDVDRAAGSGRRFGRVLKGETTWGFSLFTNGANEDDGWAKLAALQSAWESVAGDDDVVESDTYIPLRYKVAGKERVVWGQPRRFTATPDNLSMSGRIPIEADFDLAYPLYLDGTEKVLSLPILAPLELDAGLVVPFVAPFNSAAGSSPIQSEVTIGGERSTPIRIKFIAGTGTLHDAFVQVGGKTVQLEELIYPGDPVTADARPWVRSITTQSGGLVAVAPRVTRLAELWLPPGKHQVIFNGVDPTSSARIEVRWQDAYRTYR